MASKKVLVILAEGFEETEAVAPVDVLRRLGYEVVIAGLASLTVKGSHGISIVADSLLSELKGDGFDAVMLPGGMPGSATLRDSDAVMDVLKSMSAAGKVVSAICAAPIALARAGLTEGRWTTGYPGSEQGSQGLSYTGRMSERDGTLVTGKAPGAAFDFAAQLALALGTPETDVNRLFEVMFVSS